MINQYLTKDIKVFSLTLTDRQLKNFQKHIEVVDTGYVDEAGNASPCHMWKGGLTDKGYGQFWVSGMNLKAHRVSYMHFVGPIPVETPQVHHKCEMEGCTNPAHLTPVTNDENCYYKWTSIYNAKAIAQERR